MLRTAFILFVLVSPAIAQRPQQSTNLGNLITAHLFATDSLAAEELKLKPEQKAQLRAFANQFISSEDFRTCERLSRQWSVRHWDVEDYYNNGIIAESDFIDDVNDRVLEEIDRILDTQRKRRRFRELATMGFLRFGHFDSALRLNKIKLKLKDYKTLSEAIPKNKFDDRDPLLMYEVALGQMGRFLTEEEIAESQGEIFKKAYIHPAGRLVNTMGIREQFQDTPLELITSPRITVELGMTADQAREALVMAKQLQAEMSEAKAQRIYSEIGTRVENGEKPEDLTKEFATKMAEWRKKIDSEIDKLLNDEQRKRFNQLLFQLHVSRTEVSWALKAAGKPFEPDNRELRLDRNEVQAESWYVSQAGLLRAGIVTLGTVLGEDKVKELCGDIKLPPSLHRHLVKNDDEIRQRVIESILDLQRSERPNPRRRNRRAGELR